MSLHIREARTSADYEALRDDWNRLARLEGSGVRSFDASATFEWSQALWEAFPAHRPACILVAQDEQGVKGLLPCTVAQDTVAQVRYRRLTPTTGIYDLRTGFLVGGDAAVLASLLAHAKQHVSGWDALAFRTVDGGPSEAAMQGAVRQLRLNCVTTWAWRTPFIALPAHADQVMDSISQKLRSNVRRAERQLLKMGSLQMRLYEAEDTSVSFLAVMAEVEALSWKMQAGTAMVGSDQQKAMYEAVTRAMSRSGHLLGAALFLGDRPLAFIYGYAHDGVFVDEKESYDDEFKDFGPGNLLKTQFLQELIRRGVSVLDYGGTEDPHKARWTDKTYSRKTHLLFNSTWRGQLLRLSLAARHWWRAEGAHAVPLTERSLLPSG